MDIAVAVHWLTDTTLECLLFSSINAIYHEFDLQTRKSVFELSPNNFGLDLHLKKQLYNMEKWNNNIYCNNKINWACLIFIKVSWDIPQTCNQTIYWKFNHCQNF